MLFAEPERTGYDLNFRLLGFPVRIHPWFWLACLIFSRNLFDPDHPEFILSWVAIVLLSFLTHELGHALAYRACGVEAHVVLYALGGLAVPWDDLRGRWRRVAVALAGPLAGFALAGVVWVSDQASPWAHAAPITGLVYSGLMYINLMWGAVNLLPVIPLDGGRVSQEVCTHFLGYRGTRAALQISMVTAAAVAVYSLLCLIGAPQLNDLLRQLPWWVPRGGIWTLVLFGVLAYQSYTLLQHLRWTDSHWDQ